MKRAVHLSGGACCLYHGVLLNDINVVPIDPAWYLQWEQSSHYYLFLDLKHTAVGTSLLWLVQWKVSLCFVILAFSKLHRFCQHVIRRISVASVFPRAIGTIQQLLHYHDAMVWNAASRFYDRGYLNFQQLPPPHSIKHGVDCSMCHRQRPTVQAHGVWGCSMSAWDEVRLERERNLSWFLSQRPRVSQLQTGRKWGHFLLRYSRFGGHLLHTRTHRQWWPSVSF